MDHKLVAWWCAYPKPMGSTFCGPIRPSGSSSRSLNSGVLLAKSPTILAALAHMGLQSRENLLIHSFTDRVVTMMSKKCL
jgi:hypothetical protein